jgi:hypothetical protein
MGKDSPGSPVKGGGTPPLIDYFKRVIDLAGALEYNALRRSQLVWGSNDY